MNHVLLIHKTRQKLSSMPTREGPDVISSSPKEASFNDLLDGARALYVDSHACVTHCASHVMQSCARPDSLRGDTSCLAIRGSHRN